jgi:hypothetical protein
MNFPVTILWLQYITLQICIEENISRRSLMASGTGKGRGWLIKNYEKSGT